MGVTNFLYVVTFGLQFGRLLTSKERRVARAAMDGVRFVSRGVGLWCLFGAGLCEAVAFVLLPVFAARLPGSLLPVMSQGLLLFSMLFSTVLFGRRYDAIQLLGVALVVLGVATCSVLSAPIAGHVVSAGSLLDALGLLSAYAFVALSLSLKELAFLRFRERAGACGDAASQKLRVEVVNLFSAIWQGVAVLLFWPLNFVLLTPLGVRAYFQAFAAALRSTPAFGTLLWLYLPTNLAYTILTTLVLERLSAVTIVLTNVLNVPLVSLLFCLELPLLGAAPFRWSFVVGLGVIASGLLLYSHRSFEMPRRVASTEDGL